MKLQLRFFERGGSGPCHILTDEHGFALPNQREVRIAYVVNEPPIITVTFYADGEGVAVTGLPVASDMAVLTPGIVAPGIMRS